MNCLAYATERSVPGSVSVPRTVIATISPPLCLWLSPSASPQVVTPSMHSANRVDRRGAILSLGDFLHRMDSHQSECSDGHDQTDDPVAPPRPGVEGPSRGRRIQPGTGRTAVETLRFF